MIDEKKIEAAKEVIYEDRFLLNGEEVVFDNDAKEEMFYKEDIKEASITAFNSFNNFKSNCYSFSNFKFFHTPNLLCL